MGSTPFLRAVESGHSPPAGGRRADAGSSGCESARCSRRRRPGHRPRCGTGVGDALALEHAEEALGRSLVAAMADGAHAQGDVVIFEELLVVVGCELCAPVRVQNDGPAPRSLPAGHQHGPEDELAVLPGRHRPPHDPAPEQVEHDAQVEPALGRVDVRDVGDPFGIGLGRGEVALEVIADVRRSLGPR